MYIICPSCNYLIGNRQIPYEKGLASIDSNPNTDEQTKLELKTKLIESLKLPRYCCKMRLTTYKQKTEIFI